MEWDDQWMLLNHPMLLNQRPENIWYFFTHFDRGQYFPLNQLYYLGIYQLTGFSPTAYHAGSLLLHGVNTGLVFLLMRNLVNYIGIEVKTMSAFGLIFLVPLLFAIHPLQVEAVAWISASKVLLYSTFTLTGLICYIHYKRSGKIFMLLLVFLCYTLSLMSKEQAIIFPFNLLLIDLMLHIYHKKRFSGKVILEKVPFFVLALLFWYWSVQNNLGVLDMAGGYTLDQRLVLGSYSMIIYIFRFLLPVNLLSFYGFPIVAGESVAPFFYIYVLLGILLALYIIDLYRRRRFVPFFGLLFFLANIFWSCTSCLCPGK